MQKTDRPLINSQEPLRALRATLAIGAVLAIGAMGMTTVHAQQAKSASEASVSAAAAAGLATMQNSTTTVNQVLDIESLTLLNKARKDAEAAGLIRPAPPVTQASGGAGPAAPVTATLEVISIGGMEGALHATLVYNGERIARASVGDRVDGCRVASIDGRKVTLRSASKSVPAGLCPTASWTGTKPPQMAVAPVLPPGVSMTPPAYPGAPQQFSVGAPSGLLNGSSRLARATPEQLAVGQVGQVPATAQGAPGATPSLPLSVVQPTIEMVPARAARAGETSVPLVPRQLQPNVDPSN